MRAQRERDTGVERALRSELHARGLRYRLHRRLLEGTRREADLVFGPARVAVFVDGCFWHGCPEHGRAPKANAGYWGPKLAGNVARDRDTDAQLDGLGWRVVRAWEHRDPEAVADRVERIVRSQPAARGRG